jgi:hypothetical protein
MKSKALSTNIDSNSSIPYFMWDDPMTVEEIKNRLATASQPERNRLLGKILREAKDTDVWEFTTPIEFWNNWDELSKHLGRRKDFWEFLFKQWKKAGLIG